MTLGPNATWFPSMIRSRSTAEPAPRSQVAYTAAADQSVEDYAVAVPMSVPIGVLTYSPEVEAMLPPEHVPLIVPANVGDPCWIVRVGATYRLFVFTEAFQLTPCGGGAP